MGIHTEPTNRSHPICIPIYTTHMWCEYICIPIYILYITSSPLSWFSIIMDLLTMGWLRWVGALKLQVSFAQYRLFDRALLQKRPILLRSLLIVVTPYLLNNDLPTLIFNNDWSTVFIRLCSFYLGWLWLVGSIKLQVSFAKEPYKRDDILQKRNICTHYYVSFVLILNNDASTDYLLNNDWSTLILNNDWSTVFILLSSFYRVAKTHGIP